MCSCQKKKKKSRHDHKRIVMNELNHIHFHCWLHIYSSEFTLSVYVRNPSLRITFRSCSPVPWFGLMLKVKVIMGCAGYSPLAPPEPLSVPPNQLCPGRLIHMGCVKALQLSGFLSSLSKGKHYQKVEGKEENELKDKPPSLPSPTCHFTSSNNFLLLSLSGPKNLSLPLSLAGFPLSFLHLL